MVGDTADSSRLRDTAAGHHHSHHHYLPLPPVSEALSSVTSEISVHVQLFSLSSDIDRAVLRHVRGVRPNRAAILDLKNSVLINLPI